MDGSGLGLTLMNLKLSWYLQKVISIMLCTALMNNEFPDFTSTRMFAASLWMSYSFQTPLQDKQK